MLFSLCCSVCVYHQQSISSVTNTDIDPAARPLSCLNTDVLYVCCMCVVAYAYMTVLTHQQSTSSVTNTDIDPAARPLSCLNTEAASLIYADMAPPLPMSSCSLNDINSQFDAARSCRSTPPAVSTNNSASAPGAGEFPVCREEYQPVRQHNFDSSLIAEPQRTGGPSSGSYLANLQPFPRAANDNVTSQRSVESLPSGDLVVPGCHTSGDTVVPGRHTASCDQDVFSDTVSSPITHTATVDPPPPPLPPKTSVVSHHLCLSVCLSVCACVRVCVCVCVCV